MANIDTGSGGEKKNKPKKLSVRVDFTPLVDMNMLLLTFFMFCTTMSRPQVMELALPSRADTEYAEEDLNKVRDSKTVTLILGGDDKVYYYFGKVTAEMYEDRTSLTQTDYSADGLRAVLLGRNREAIERMRELKLRKYHKEITDSEFREKSEEIRTDPDGQVVLIKPTDESSYENLVDALDEMQICSIGTYALVEMTEADTYLLDNYLGRGERTQTADNS